MLEIIDKFLNRITMYRLALYYLVFLLAVAGLLSWFGILPFTPLALLISALTLLAICLIANYIFARVFSVPANVESAYITAFILALIITPPQAGSYFSHFGFLFWAAAWAMASKYILAIKNKHIFNPAALAVALTAFTINQSASWWVGSSSMLMFVLLGGLLVIRKVQRSDMALFFAMAALVTIVGLTFTHTNPVTMIYKALADSPLIFFAAIMLTEPLTTPPTKSRQIFYGALVGFLFAPQLHFGPIYSTPELALLVGNLFSFILSPKGRHVMKLTAKEKISEGVYNFVFAPDKKINFRPGQYMEWTLGHNKPDSRGNRRYFTLASSPTENEVLLGVKFYEHPSSFKNKLKSLNIGDKVMASQLAGDFVLPKDSGKKLAFIAGGIGVTPFRSMLKYLMDKNEKRSVVTIYSSATLDEVAYYDVFQQAGRTLGAETVFTLTDQAKIDPQWQGHRGYISQEMIAKEIPDYKERIFYISGPRSLINSCEKILEALQVPKSQIKTDFFPGLA